MAVRPDDTDGIGDIELLQSPPLPMTADAILEDFTHYFARTLGRRTIHTRSPFLYQSVVLAARDRLMERWNKTRIANERDDSRLVSYLSLEFLMGRLLRNALISLGKVAPVVIECLLGLFVQPEIERLAKRPVYRKTGSAVKRNIDVYSVLFSVLNCLVYLLENLLVKLLPVGRIRPTMV